MMAIKQIDLCNGNVLNVWPNAAQASRELGIIKTSILRVANKTKYYHTAGGYGWEYVISRSEITT